MSFLFVLFCETVSLCNSPGYSGTYSVDQAGLELRLACLCLPSDRIKGQLSILPLEHLVLWSLQELGAGVLRPKNPLDFPLFPHSLIISTSYEIFILSPNPVLFLFLLT